MIQREATPLALLLRRAQMWEESGQTYQAAAAYFSIVEYHPGTDEAVTARGRLLNLAQRLEIEGNVYQATHLYQRLASLRAPVGRVHPGDEKGTQPEASE